MTSIPFLSIIIPVYNMEKSLEISINSILEQTFENWEIIIIDDGSRDSSCVIGQRYSEKFSNITYFFQENRGVSAARNLGIEKARGGWIIFMDADDYWGEDYLQNIFEQAHFNCEIIITGLTKVLENGSRQVILPPNFGLFSVKQVLEDFVHCQLKYGIFGFVSNKIIKTEIVRHYELKFNEELVLCEDLDFFVNYLKYCDQVFLSSEGSNYYNYIPKKNAVDYISLIGVFKNIEQLLIKKDLYNQNNQLELINFLSNLKYSYFNELVFINEQNIKVGFDSLNDILLRSGRGINEKIIKFLLDKERFKLLKQYLQLRHNYIKMKRKWM